MTWNPPNSLFPGLLLSGLYVVYIVLLCRFKPALAPIPDSDFGPDTGLGVFKMVLRSFIPPIFLIFLVLGSILMGWATPTEAAGVGAAGAILLAFVNLVILPVLGVEHYHLEVSDKLKDIIDDESTSGSFMDEFAHFGRVLWASIFRSAMTNAMLFGIFIGATIFSYVFRSLGGDDIVIELVESLGFG